MYTEDFCCTFLEDVLRLCHEEDVAVLYKPKRDYQHANWPLPSRMERVFNQAADDPRWTTLPADTNPWIPVLLSDLVVAIPFTSIALAALTHDIPFVFHNATDKIKFHRYHMYESRITQSYEDLRRIVTETSKRDANTAMDVPRDGIAQEFVNFLRDPEGLSIGAEI